MKPCSKCGRENKRNGRYCHACHREYMVKYRAEEKRALREFIWFLFIRFVMKA